MKFNFTRPDTSNSLIKRGMYSAILDTVTIAPWKPKFPEDADTLESVVFSFNLSMEDDNGKTIEKTRTLWTCPAAEKTAWVFTNVCVALGFDVDEMESNSEEWFEENFGEKLRDSGGVITKWEGAECLVKIDHVKSDGKIYANIRGTYPKETQDTFDVKSIIARDNVPNPFGDD